MDEEFVEVEKIGRKKDLQVDQCRCQNLMVVGGMGHILNKERERE